MSFGNCRSHLSLCPGKQSRGLCREVTWCLALSSTRAFLFHHRVAISQTHLWNTCPIPSCPKGLQAVVHSLQRTTILQCTLPTHPEYMCKHSFYVPPQTMVSFNTPCAHFSNTIVLRYFCSLFLPCSFPWHPVTTALICGNVLLARPRNHPAVKQHFLSKIFNRIL